MKHLRLVLLASVVALGLARAQDEQQQRPPTEIPDFSNLDDYIYEPKSILSIGFRRLSGPKFKFFGAGKLKSKEDAGPATGVNLTRTYHDGNVAPDARFAARVDGSGNPVRDPDSGSQIFDPIAPDGRTNTWSLQSAAQVTTDGFIKFNNYSADVTDTAIRSTDGTANFGLELAVSRDMGKLLGTRTTWHLIAGMSINDLSGSKSDNVQARITALSDLYSLDGQVSPTAPYSAPSSTTTSILDSAGNAVFNPADGSVQSVSVDTTTLITNQPSLRTSSTVTDSTSVTSRWKLSGAYYTFRAGATVLVPFGSRFRATFSAGPALVYAGSTYAVNQVFTPETGAEISDTSVASTSRLLPGYYADATLQFDLTERTGFYAGAVMQGAGDYTQNLSTIAAQSSTKIDLAKQQGFRGGMTIRF